MRFGFGKRRKRIKGCHHCLRCSAICRSLLVEISVYDTCWFVCIKWRYELNSKSDARWYETSGWKSKGWCNKTETEECHYELRISVLLQMTTEERQSPLRKKNIQLHLTKYQTEIWEILSKLCKVSPSRFWSHTGFIRLPVGKVLGAFKSCFYWKYIFFPLYSPFSQCK